MRNNGALRVLALTNMWPSLERPAFGVFVAAQMRAVRECGVHIDVDFVDGRRRLAYARCALRMLALNLGRRRYHLVHAHTGHCGALALLQRRTPTLVSYVGYDLYGKATESGGITRKSAIEARLFRWLASKPAATITKSAELGALLPAGARECNMVLPNGVDQTLFRPMPREKARSALAWPADRLMILFAGDPAVARKRYALARAAVEIVARAQPAAQLRVCVSEPQEHVPLWMNAADVLVMSSVAEGSPNVVKEALACGLPVVAVDVGDVRELLLGVEPSKVVPRDADAATIASALLEILREAPRRSNGRERTAHLDGKVVAQQLVELYHDIVAHGCRTAEHKARRNPVVELT